MADSGGDEDEQKTSKCFVQNKALSTDLRNKKRKIALLKGKVKRLKTKQRTFDTTCSLVNQTWSQLDTDLETILTLHGKNAPTQEASTSSSSLVPDRPHLKELLQLQNRGGATKELASGALKRESLKDLQFDDDIDIFLKQEEMEGGKDAPSDGDDDAVQDDIAETRARVEKEAEALLSHRRDFTVSLLRHILAATTPKDGHVDNGLGGGLVTKQHKVVSALASSQDQVCTLEQIVTDLRVQVQEAELEKHRAIRDLNRFKVHESMGGRELGTTPSVEMEPGLALQLAGRQSSAGSAASTPRAATAATASTPMSGTDGPSVEVTEEFQKELSTCKDMAAKRLKELEALRTEHGKLKGQLANTHHDGAPVGEAFVKKHVLYVQALQTLEVEKANAAKHLKDYTKCKSELDTAREDYQRNGLYKDKALKDLKGIQQKLQQHFAQELKLLNDKCDTLQMTVDEGLEAKQHLEQTERAFKEMKETHQSLLEENASLKRVTEMRERQTTMDLKQGLHQTWRGDMKKEIDSLQARVDGNMRSAQKTAMSMSNPRLNDHLGDMAKLMDLLTQSQQSCKSELALCKEDVEASRLESESLLPEIESIAATNDDLRKQLEKVRAEISQKEEHYLKTMHARSKIQQMLSLLEGKCHALEGNIVQNEVTGNKQTKVLESTRREMAMKDKKLQTLEGELQRLTKQFRMLASQQRDIQHARESSALELERLKQSYEKVKGNNLLLGTEAEECKHKFHRAEEDAARLKKRVSQLEKTRDKELRRQSSSASTDETSGVLMGEIARLKKKVYCSITEADGEEHEKNCMIVQCGHTFSRMTVDKLITLRSRKCPLCGLNFAQSDVKKIHL